MKARILEDYSFGGLYTEEYLNENYNLVINGATVSSWSTTSIIPTNILKPIWNPTLETWNETLTMGELQKVAVNNEYIKYIKRRDDGITAYLQLSAELRLAKVTGAISAQAHIIIETTLEPVRLEVINGQWITALNKLQNIGTSIIGQSFYDRLYNQINTYITTYY